MCSFTQVNSTLRTQREITIWKALRFSLTMPLNVHKLWSMCDLGEWSQESTLLWLSSPSQCVHIPTSIVRSLHLKYVFLYIMGPKQNQQLYLVLNQRKIAVPCLTEWWGWAYSEIKYIGMQHGPSQEVFKGRFLTVCTFLTLEPNFYVTYNSTVVILYTLQKKGIPKFI